MPAVIVLLASVPLLAMWLPEEVDEKQARNLRTLGISLGAAIALLLWFVALAPVSWRVRLGGLVVTLLAALGFALLYEIESPSGDFALIIRRRGTTRPDTQIGKLEIPATIEAAPLDAPNRKSGLQDFPQFLGANRDGRITLRGEQGAPMKLLRDWSQRKPTVLWRRPLGAAWSGFAVYAGAAGHPALAITQEQRDREELVVAYDIATGQPLWQHIDKTRYDTTIAGVGPRATPTIAIMGPSNGIDDSIEPRVYVLGATGILNCLDYRRGMRQWSVDLRADTGAGEAQWGFAGSPLIAGNLVIVQSGADNGASLIAYDRITGKRTWGTGSEGLSYASPMIATIAGVQQIVMLNHTSCTGHDIASGAELWRYPWRGATPKAAQPVPIGEDRIVISAGYGIGADAFKVVRAAPEGNGERGGDRADSAADRPSPAAWRVEPLWKSMHLKAKFANFVLRDGHLFGLNDGTLACIEVTTGRRTWRGEDYGHGQLLLIDDLLLILAESGDVVLVEANAADFRELSRFKVFDDKTWNSPALAGRYLLIRNDREAACLELPLE